MSDGLDRPRNVLMFGASGVGCSTIGAGVAARLAYQYLDTDDLFWLPTDPPFVRTRDPSDACELLEQNMMAARGCVVGGTLNGWAERLGVLFDAAILLHAAADVRLARILERQKQRFGGRIEPGGDMHARHVAFLDWAAGYDTGATLERNLSLHERWGQSLPCGVQKVENDASPEVIVERVIGLLRAWPA